MCSRFIAPVLTSALLVLNAAGLGGQADPAPTFKASVDLVRVSAVVRDRKGRFVRDLSARDFEVFDDGQQRAIAEIRNDLAGVSVALLFDVSGSMAAKLANARQAAEFTLSGLDPGKDEAAVFTIDTRLVEVTPFTAGLRTLPESMSALEPFGATSLHDGIALTAEVVSKREGRRRAVVVFTDGNDNASRLSAAEASGIASSIDVPVYIFGIVPAIDNPSADTAVAPGRSPLAGPLADMSMWTGGRVVLASTPAERRDAARQIIDELRHQYLMAFESGARPGWHPLVVRTREKALTVRARGGYIVGQSRPYSD
jgi:Ca-activated chloride channel family protein